MDSAVLSSNRETTMKISSTMDLHQLAELMGDCATEAEAKRMRATLEGIGAWERTEDVPEAEWLKMLNGSVAQAKHDGNFTYSTDSTASAKTFATEDEALAAAIKDGDWSPIDSAAERSFLAEGGWLCIFDDGIPSLIRGVMP